MTNESLISPNDPRDLYENQGGFAPALELSEDITARPLVMPDFINIEPSIMGRGLSFRWMFTDQRRFSQARAMGWRVATKADIKNGELSPYITEGGSKFINGDLVLMCIDRKIYLGALRYKHEVAARLADASIQKTVSAQRAASDLGSKVAAVNRQRAAAGQTPVMQVFTPGGADVHEVPAASEMGRLGHDGPVDTGNAASLGQEQQKQQNT